MTGHDHHSSHPAEVEHADDIARRVRYGLILFGIYVVLYAGYMLVNAFAPKLMEMTPLWGVNLAILYGFALIFAAFALALVYAWLCRSVETGSPTEQGPRS